MKRQTSIATRPLLIIVLPLSLGIICARFVSIPFYLILICGCLLLTISIVWFRKRRVYTVGVLAATFFIGWLLYINSTTLPRNHIKYLTPYKSRIVTVEGVVTSFPITRLTRYGKEKIEFIIRVKRLVTENEGQKNHTSFRSDEDKKKICQDKIELSPFVTVPFCEREGESEGFHLG